MLLTAYLMLIQQNLFLQVISFSPFFHELRNFWEGSDGTAVPMQNGSLTRDIPSFWMLVSLLLLFWWHQLATIKQLTPTTRLGLLLALAPMWALQEIALGVYRPVCQTPPQVALWDLCGAFPAINERCVAMILICAWWSQEGSCARGRA